MAEEGPRRRWPRRRGRRRRRAIHCASCAPLPQSTPRRVWPGHGAGPGRGVGQAQCQLFFTAPYRCASNRDPRRDWRFSSIIIFILFVVVSVFTIDHHHLTSTVVLVLVRAAAPCASSGITSPADIGLSRHRAFVAAAAALPNQTRHRGLPRCRGLPATTAACSVGHWLQCWALYYARATSQAPLPPRTVPSHAMPKSNFLTL